MKIKLCLLGDNGVHMQRWLSAFSQDKQFEVYAISFHETIRIPNVNYFFLKKFLNNKLDYVLNIFRLKKILKQIQPDVLHAHYASSNGFLGALSGAYPFIVSIWGDDILYFPEESFITKHIMKYTLSKADRILVTSDFLKKSSLKYTDKLITVLPFGIDSNLFRPMQVKKYFKENDIVIGTVKSFYWQYGIEYLLQAFQILKNKNTHLPLKLLLVGGGVLESKFKKMAMDLKIDGDTIFTGSVPHSEAMNYHNMLDIFVALSVSESFGVSVLEASSCEKPVVVSNVGGLPEVVEDGKTGYIVPAKNPEAAALAIEKLILNKELRIKMGGNGREKVIREYEWKHSIQTMKQIYLEMLK